MHVCPECGQVYSPEESEERPPVCDRCETAMDHTHVIPEQLLINELEEFTQHSEDDREDIVECSECGMRQYRENWDGECLDCGATIVQNPVKQRCTDCGHEQEWPDTPDSFTPECDECGGYMEDLSQKGENAD